MINKDQLQYMRTKMQEKHQKEQDEKKRTREKNNAIYNAFA